MTNIFQRKYFFHVLIVYLSDVTLAENFHLKTRISFSDQLNPVPAYKSAGEQNKKFYKDLRKQKNQMKKAVTQFSTQKYLKLHSPIHRSIHEAIDSSSHLYRA